MSAEPPPAGTIISPPAWLEIVGPCVPLWSVPKGDPMLDRVLRHLALGEPGAEGALFILKQIRPIAQESTERN